MTQHVPSPAPETMLAHRHFIRSIVRSLLRSCDGEDDVVQQAMVQAWQHGGKRRGRLEPWLARICRNLAFDHLRAARRRERTRSGLDEPSPLPSAADVLQREEERQRIVRAVLALPEPYRSTVLLRYWEELSSAEIARRLGVPGATIRSRLDRGLALLRTRLDADYGGRAAWFAALLPFSAPGQLTAGAAAGATAATAATAFTTLSTMGALLMTKTKLIFAIAGLAIAGLMAWLFVQDDVPAVSPRPDDASSVATVASGSITRDAARPALSAADGTSTPAGTRIEAPAGDLVVRGETLSSGVPIADFAVILQWFDGVDSDGAPASEHELRSDAEGKFVWRGPVRQRLATVRVTARTSAAKVWAASEVVLPGPQEVSLQLPVILLDRELFGRVHDGAGAPIAGARLTVNRWAETAAVTGVDGRYELRVPAPGYPLLVTADRHQHRLIEAYMPAESRRHEFDVELRELQPGGSFTGRVVDEAAKPVAGARVRASGLFGEGVLTDADGRFELGGAGPGSNHGLTATRKGFMRGEVTAQPGGDAVEIVLRPGLTVTLRVIGPDGEAIVGAKVFVVPNQGSGWQPRGVTREDGRQALEDLAPAPFDVIVQKAGFIQDRREVKPAEVLADIVIALRPGQSASGRVLDAAGQPVPGASVYCRRTGADPRQGEVGTRATSDAGGRFEVADLPPEPCTVFAHHEDYSRAEVEGVTGSRTDLVLRMLPAPMVAGRVVDGVTGMAIEAFTVQVVSDHRVQPLHMDPLLFEHSDGYWQARHWQMKVGAELFVEVRAKGYAPSRVRSEARLDAPRDQNVIRLFAGTTLTGVVRDAVTGTPIPGVLVVLQPGDPTADLHRFFTRVAPLEHRGGISCRTDAAGAFTLEPAPAGPNRLELGHADYPETTFGPFDVGAGPGTLEVQPTLRHGVTVRGRVTGLAEAAGRSVRAWCVSRMLEQSEAQVQPDLTFTLSGLGEGTWRVTLATEAGRSHSTDVIVAAQAVEGVVLAVRSGSGSIRCTVHGLDRGHAQVSTITAAGQPRTGASLTFANGAFVLEGLPPGRYRVTVHAEDWPSEGTAEVSVESGEATVAVEYKKRR